mgnify:CR=1 FL=1
MRKRTIVGEEGGRTDMRLKLAILAAVMVVASACSGAATPGPAQSTEADIDPGGPVAITLWHTQTGGNAAALTAAEGQLHSTNGEGVPVALRYQGTYTPHYPQSLSQSPALAPPDRGDGYWTRGHTFPKSASAL